MRILKIYKISYFFFLLSFSFVLLLPTASAVYAGKFEINKKPKTYGVYIYRGGEFIGLEKVNLNYSGKSYSTSFFGTQLAACYVDKKNMSKAKDFRPSDLLALYLPHNNRSWSSSTLTYFPEASFEGQRATIIERRPEGYYSGFYATGSNGQFPHFLGDLRSQHGYWFESDRVNSDTVVFSTGEIIFTRLFPNEKIPIANYIITTGGFSMKTFHDSKSPAEQLPSDGYVVKFSKINNSENFKAKRESLERYNINNSMKHLVEEKEFLLTDKNIVNTGITVNGDAHVRFVSERNFQIILENYDWDINGFIPFKGNFRQDYVDIENGKKRAYRIKHRDFSLRYKGRNRPEVKIRAIKPGTKVKVIYSPYYCKTKEWSNFNNQAREDIKRGDFSAAVENYGKILKISPENPSALNSLAWLYATAKNKDFRNAKKALDIALRADRNRPGQTNLLDTISVAYFEYGDLNKAIGYEEKAYSNWYNKPDNYKKNMKKYNKIKAHLREASKHQEDEMYDEAIVSIESALELMPNCFSAYNSLAWLYATAKDNEIKSCDNALKYANIAYKIAPDNPGILDTLAESHFLCGDKNNAIE